MNIFYKKNLHKVLSFICVMALFINPLASIAYADQEDSGPPLIVESISDEEGSDPDLSDEEGLDPGLSDEDGLDPDLFDEEGSDPDLSDEKGLDPDLSDEEGLDPDLSAKRASGPVLFSEENEAPTISGLPAEMKMDVGKELIITFMVGDNETPAGDLEVTVTADNTILFPNPFVVINTDGSIRATSTPAEAGSTTITVTVSDGELTIDETMSIVPNSPPVAVNDTATVDEDAFIEIDVLDNDTDEDDDSLTIIDVTAPDHGTAEITGTSDRILYTPTTEWNGEDSFSYVIEDTSGATATAVVTVTVEPITPGPSISFDSGVGSWSAEVEATITETETMPPDGSIQYRIGTEEWQTYTIPVQMTEEGVNTLYARILKNSEGVATMTTSAEYKLDQSGPVISASETWDGVSTSQTITVDFSDPYSGVAVTKYAEGDQDAEHFLEGGTAFVDSFDFEAEYGEKYTLYAIDNCGNATVKSFELRNTPPEITEISDTLPGVEDQEFSFTFTVSDVQTSAGSLIVEVSSDDTNLLPDIFTIENIDGFCRATTTPGLDKNGSATLTISVFDGELTRTETVTVNISPVNDLPIAVDDPDATTNKNIPVEIDVLANDSDVDIDENGDEILIVDILGVTHGTVDIIGGGTSLIYTPANNWHGIEEFTYVIADKEGERASATVTVQVNYIDYPPVVSDLESSYEVNEDESFDITFELYDDETQNETITAQVTSSNQTIIKNSKITTTGLGTAGSTIGLHIVPEADQNGDVVITIKASDGFNIETYTFTLHVLPVNDAPVAHNDSIPFTEDETITFHASELLNNDRDIDSATLYFAEIVQDVSKGTLEYDAETEMFTYIPEPDAEDNVTFTYRVSDGELESDNVATVTLVCTPVNDVPWLTGDGLTAQTMYEDGVLSAISFQVGDPETEAQYLIVTVGSSNQSVVNDNKIEVDGDGEDRTLTIRPNANANTGIYGPTTIHITVSDGELFATKSFPLTVSPVQDPPTAVDDIAAVRIGESIVI